MICWKERKPLTNHRDRGETAIFQMLITLLQPPNLDSAENVAKPLAIRSTHFAVPVTAKADKPGETNPQGPSRLSPKALLHPVAAVVEEGAEDEDEDVGEGEVKPTPDTPTGLPTPW